MLRSGQLWSLIGVANGADLKSLYVRRVVGLGQGLGVQEPKATIPPVPPFPSGSGSEGRIRTGWRGLARVEKNTVVLAHRVIFRD